MIAGAPRARRCLCGRCTDASGGRGSHLRTVSRYGPEDGEASPVTRNRGPQGPWPPMRSHCALRRRRQRPLSVFGRGSGGENFCRGASVTRQRTARDGPLWPPALLFSATCGTTGDRGCARPPKGAGRSAPRSGGDSLPRWWMGRLRSSARSPVACLVVGRPHRRPLQARPSGCVPRSEDCWSPPRRATRPPGSHKQ